jgi:hypothetical protein
MNLPDIGSHDSVTDKYEFLIKLEHADSQLHKCLLYVERFFRLEEMIATYRNFLCEHFRQLLLKLLESPNLLSFEYLLLEHLTKLDTN